MSGGGAVRYYVIRYNAMAESRRMETLKLNAWLRCEPEPEIVLYYRVRVNR